MLDVGDVVNVLRKMKDDGNYTPMMTISQQVLEDLNLNIFLNQAGTLVREFAMERKDGSQEITLKKFTQLTFVQEI